MPVILIADSGSTKTDWMLLAGREEPRMFRTPGMNPYYHDQEAMIGLVRENSELCSLSSQVTELFYYGAGCTDSGRIQRVRESLGILFPNGRLSVSSDLLGAARAVLGGGKGLVGILGTGSNSGIYDGNSIISSVPSLGFVLGDEGSGSYLGRLFIRGLLSGRLAQEIRNDFDGRFGLSQEDIVTATLSRPMPNRFLASFCEFFSHYLGDPVINDLAKQGFCDFMEAHIVTYNDFSKLPLGLVGSIAHHFQGPLREVIAGYGIADVRIMHTPVEALAAYHSPLD